MKQPKSETQTRPASLFQEWQEGKTDGSIDSNVEEYGYERASSEGACGWCDVLGGKQLSKYIVKIYQRGCELYGGSCEEHLQLWIDWPGYLRHEPID